MLGNRLQGLTGDLADPHGRFDMDAGRICIVSAAALLALAATRNVSTILRQPAFEFKLGFAAFGLAG